MFVAVQLDGVIEFAYIAIRSVVVPLVDNLAIAIQRDCDEVSLIADTLCFPGEVIPLVGFDRARYPGRHPVCIRGVPHTPLLSGACVALGTENIFLSA